MAIFAAALIIFAGNVWADEVIKRSDGVDVLLKADHTWEEIGLSSSTAASLSSADDALSVWDTTLLEKEYNYSRAVTFAIHYWNHTGKKIVGAKVSFEIKNVFGKTLYSDTVEDEISLEPNEKQRSEKFWVFEDNKFINGEPYDRLWEGAKNGTAKVSTKILKVIFDDGTVLQSRGIAAVKAKKHK